MLAIDSYSQIRFQLVWDRLIAVVEEQARTLVRTAFGTATREAGDVSAGFFDREGRMLAQAITGTPGHVNSMAMSVGHFLDRFPIDTMRPGDVYITNDPWLGTGHLYDVTMVTPAFRGEAAVGLFANTVHLVDIGGRGVPGEARQVYEEGLCIPIMKLVDAGRMSEELLGVIRVNVREPVQVVGDLYSQVSCNDVGARRLLDLMRDFGLETMDGPGEFILDRTREASIAAIRALPKGTVNSELVMDGFDSPIRLKAALTINDDFIEVDFEGTSGLSRAGFNVPLCYTEAYASFGIKCIVAPDIPNNAASLATIRVKAPANSIVNAQHPAPVAARSLVGHMIPDLMFGCLHQILPDRVPAESSSCLWNVRLMGGPGRVDADPELLKSCTPFNITAFHAGGVGARPTLDGLSATAFPSGVRNVQVEMSEAVSPILVWRKEYRPDSGGVGRFRGGLGQVMEIESSEGKPIAIAAVFDRIVYPPRGRAGGQNGEPGALRLSSGGELRSKGHQTIPAGDRIILEFPGGGGYGNPGERRREKILEDLENGLISEDAAERHYGLSRK